MSHRFSIVIPTLDRRDMLAAALASVAEQQWPDVEIIVVDGGSTDGTLDMLTGRSDIRVLTGPDAGVYDAFNKGIACTTGDVVGILNSDDRYERGAFAAVSAALDAVPDAHAVCGISSLVDGERILAVYDDDQDMIIATPRTVLIGACVPNARFFRRTAMARIGTFDAGLRFVADRDWLLRWYEAGLTTIALRLPVYRYVQHAGSLTFDAEQRSNRAIRIELAALARRWQNDPHSSAATRRMATLLAGRCLAVQAITAARRGRIREAFTSVFLDDGRLTWAAPCAIVAAGFDWLVQYVKRRLHR